MQIIEALDYMGPNRRFENTALELAVRFSDEEAKAVSATIADLPQRLNELLHATTTDFPHIDWSCPGKPPALETLGHHFGALCGALQAWAGHPAGPWLALATRDPLEWRYVFSKEESATAEKAADVAFLLIARSIAGLTWTSRTGESESSPDEWLSRFRSYAGPLAMPADSLALVRAAARAGIPAVKLERSPYGPQPGPHRIRPNSLLMLGHARHKHVLDGMICLTRTPQLVPLLHDQEQRLAWLVRHGLTVPEASPDWPEVSVLLCGSRVLEVMPGDPSAGGEPPPHPPQSLARALGSLGAGLLLTRCAHSASSGEWCVLDVDLAPKLDLLAGVSDILLDRAAAAFLQWLYPRGTPARIPIFAVTGTNGKSTTTTLIEHILQDSGRKPGVAFSNGVRIDGREIATGDLAGIRGHYRVFESPEPDVAVLETARGGVVMRGFSFDWCNIGICLNVTEDHLGTHGVDTLEEMAEVKRSVVARARDGAVINADDAHCQSMAGQLAARQVCPVSNSRNIHTLREAFPGSDRFVLCEDHDEKSWIVTYDGPSREPLMPADEVLIYDSGRIEYNLVNAMHAAAACWIAGVPASTIRKTLATFKLTPDNLLGRWTSLDGLPFSVIFDYAHNPDGLEQVSTAVQRQPCSGLKRVTMGLPGDRSDEAMRRSVRSVCRVFDLFYLRDHADLRGRAPLEVPELIRDELLQQGVSAERIRVLASEAEAIEAALDDCRDGDFLLILTEKVSMSASWRLLRDYRERRLSRNNPGTTT